MSMSMSRGLSTRPVQAWVILIGMSVKAQAFFTDVLVVNQLLN